MNLSAGPSKAGGFCATPQGAGALTAPSRPSMGSSSASQGAMMQACSAARLTAAMRPFLTGLALLVLSGCSGPIPGNSPTAGLSCVDDSPDCIAKRQATLKHLNSDDQRAWIRQAPTPEAYASGVRLFAYQQKKSQLSCDELRRGKIEADAAPRILQGASDKLSPGQISRGKMLAHEVSRELGREIKKRC